MARTIVARQSDFSIGLRNWEATARTGRLVDIAYLCARTWRLQGVHTRVRETLKVVLAHRLACDRGGSDEA